jgi:CheY-specific phosphatase CheX
MMTMLIAQGEVAVDQAIDKAIEAATPHGWEAIILVVVMAMLIGLTGVIVRWLIKSMDSRMLEATNREERMANRLSKLEEFVQSSLVEIINETSSMTAKVLDAVTSLTVALDKRPCLMPLATQQAMIDEIISRHMESVKAAKK